ncbi:MAG: hypothetical protein M3Q66_05660 [Chloroflexota bacterium]|nr:hypothetical protein [Chloroflexota bacterium]
MLDPRPSPARTTRCDDVSDEAPLRIAGARGSTLLVTQRQLTICHCDTLRAAHIPCRTWDLGSIATVGVRHYGPLGALVATLTSGTLLPLLLLEGSQIPAARRVVDLLARPLARASIMRRTA